MDSNIIGKSHLEYVQNQIKLRQEILGKKSRNSSDIAWMNGKTSWLKLTSGVDISDQNILKYNVSSSEWEKVSNKGEEFRSKELDLPEYSGNELASQMVLQGGTLNEDGSQKFGVANDNSILPSNTSNYGFSEFGAQAMPGIISFQSETTNKGSLRFANLQIRANSTKQFEYIEALYLRLGYTMLLEWGNSSYPTFNTQTSSTAYETSNFSLSNNFLNDPPQNAEGTEYFYTEIEKNRKLSQGNYDGFLGKVTNFSWEFTKEGYYLISLKLITIGSVVESLKINIVQNSSLAVKNKNGKRVFKENQKENVLITQINQFTNPLRISESKSPTSFSPFIPFGSNQIAAQLGNMMLSYVFAEDETSFSFKSTKSEKDVLQYRKDAGEKGITSDQIDAANKIPDACAAIFGQTHFVKYLRFKALLNLLNERYLVYGEDEENDPLLFKIDTSENQYGFSNAKSISSDPSKLIVRYKGDYLGTEIEIFNDDIKSSDGKNSESNAIAPFHETVENVDVCNIMNLYFSQELLTNVINQNLNSEDGSITLFTFLKSLLNEANILLGGVNKFNLRLVDKNFGTYEKPEIIQVLEFYDEVSPFEVAKLRGEEIGTTPFVVYGFGNEVNGSRDGSFVTDYQFKTEITSKLGNMIAIGAQASGQSVGEDATLFSKWNWGLVDRILPVKLDIDAKIKALDQTTAGYLRLISSYQNYFSSFDNTNVGTTLTREENNVAVGSNLLFGVIFVDFIETVTGYGFPNCNITPTNDNSTSLSGFTQTQQAFFQKYYALEAIGRKTPTPFIGFIPVGFNITFDGLSGIRIFDKLNINSRFLPSNYGDTLDFIITKLDHSIVNNKWHTKIGTMSVPKLFGKLDLDLEAILNTLPPITTGFGSLVGHYGYQYSALATLISQTLKTKPDSNSEEGISLLDDILNRNTNGNLNLPHENKGERFLPSPLISIGKISGNATANVSFVLRNATTATGISSASTRAFKLLNQSSNKTYYDGHYYLAEPAAEALLEFGKFIEKNWLSKGNDPFLINSAYRNFPHQQGLKADSPTVAASGGSSAHGWGGAIDIQQLIARDGNKKLSSNPTINQTFRTTNEAYLFWEEHAPKFGWYNPLRLRNGVKLEESWHWEFWGKPGETLRSIAPLDPDLGKGAFSRLNTQFTNLVTPDFANKSQIPVPTLSENAALAYNVKNIGISPKTGKVIYVK